MYAMPVVRRATAITADSTLIMLVNMDCILIIRTILAVAVINPCLRRGANFLTIRSRFYISRLKKAQTLCRFFDSASKIKMRQERKRKIVKKYPLLSIIIQ